MLLSVWCYNLVLGLSFAICSFLVSLLGSHFQLPVVYLPTLVLLTTIGDEYIIIVLMKDLSITFSVLVLVYWNVKNFTTFAFVVVLYRFFEQ